MKKLFTILLSAALVFPLAACSGENDKKDSSDTESVAEVSEETKMPEIDVDPDIKKLVEEKMNVNDLGPLTQYAVKQIESKNLQLEFSLEQVNDDEEDSSKDESSKKSSKNSESSSYDLSSIGSIDVILTKNADKDIRVNLGMSMISFDILKNSDGVFSMNTRRKTYKVLQTAEQLSKLESEASSDSSGQASRIVENIKDIAGDVVGDLDTDEILNTTQTTEIKLADSGEEEYGYKDYKFERYDVTQTTETKKKVDAKKNDNSKSESKKEESSEKTETVTKTTSSKVTCYFDEENIIKVIHIESEDKKYDININVISSEIDSEELIIPDGYKEKETSKINLSELSEIFSD